MFTDSSYRFHLSHREWLRSKITKICLFCFFTVGRRHLFPSLLPLIPFRPRFQMFSHLLLTDTLDTICYTFVAHRITQFPIKGILFPTMTTIGFNLLPTFFSSHPLILFLFGCQSSTCHPGPKRYSNHNNILEIPPPKASKTSAHSTVNGGLLSFQFWSFHASNQTRFAYRLATINDVCNLEDPWRNENTNVRLPFRTHQTSTTLSFAQYWNVISRKHRNSIHAARVTVSKSSKLERPLMVMKYSSETTQLGTGPQQKGRDLIFLIHPQQRLETDWSSLGGWIGFVVSRGASQLSVTGLWRARFPPSSSLRSGRSRVDAASGWLHAITNNIVRGCDDDDDDNDMGETCPDWAGD